MIRVNHNECSLGHCGRVIGLDVQHLRRATRRNGQFFELSRLGRGLKVRRRFALLRNPFSSEFAKYFQGALWIYVALAVLITVVHNIHW